MILDRADQMTLMVHPTARQNHWQISVAVARAVTHPAAQHNCRVIEDLRLLHLFDEIRELLHQVGLDNLKLSKPVFRFAVVGQAVIAADLQLGGAERHGDLKGGDTRRIGLQSERQQVVEERNLFDVHPFLIHDRVDRRGGLGPIQPRLRHLQLLLHRPHTGQVLIELLAVGGAELPHRAYRRTHAGHPARWPDVPAACVACRAK